MKVFTNDQKQEITRIGDELYDGFLVDAVFGCTNEKIAECGNDYGEK